MDTTLYGIARLYARSGVCVGIQIFSSYSANKLFNYGCNCGVFTTYDLAEEELKDILKDRTYLIWVRKIRNLDWEEIYGREEINLTDWIYYDDYDEDDIKCNENCMYPESEEMI